MQFDKMHCIPSLPKEGHWKVTQMLLEEGHKPKIFKGRLEAQLQTPDTWWEGGSNQEASGGRVCEYLNQSTGLTVDGSLNPLDWMWRYKFQLCPSCTPE